jgi:putative lipoprotein
MGFGLGVVFLMLAAGCATLPPPPSLHGTSWVVESLDQGGLIANVEITMAFDPAGGVAGSAGCNRYQGATELADGAITFGSLATTRRACAPAVMDQEGRFLEALRRTVAYALDDRGFLELYDAAGRPVVIAGPAPQPDSETP